MWLRRETSVTYHTENCVSRAFAILPVCVLYEAQSKPGLADARNGETRWTGISIIFCQGIGPRDWSKMHVSHDYDQVLKTALRRKCNRAAFGIRLEMEVVDASA